MPKYGYWCTVEGCGRSAKTPGSAKGLCSMHYQMQRVYGRTERVIREAGMGSINKYTGYVETYDNFGRKTYEHIQVAERALGKRLPPGAEVHHITEDRADNYGPFKLVICPDHTYHMLIHKRMRRLGITGAMLKRDE